jgi:hypothetical protein
LIGAAARRATLAAAFSDRERQRKGIRSFGELPAPQANFSPGACGKLICVNWECRFADLLLAKGAIP